MSSFDCGRNLFYGGGFINCIVFCDLCNASPITNFTDSSEGQLLIFCTREHWEHSIICLATTLILMHALKLQPDISTVREHVNTTSPRSAQEGKAQVLSGNLTSELSCSYVGFALFHYVSCCISNCDVLLHLELLT